MQKSVMNDVKVEFSGYNHQGRARLSGNFQDKISDIMNKKKDPVKTESFFNAGNGT